jgi:hypothetical protein
MTYSTFILALTLWREGRGVSLAARSGIASVIRNRAQKRSDRNTAAACIAPMQFSGMTAPGDPNLVKWPSEFDPQWAECVSIAQTSGIDRTGGAIFYFTAPLTEPPEDWGRVVGTVVLDGVHFYRPDTPLAA